MGTRTAGPSSDAPHSEWSDARWAFLADRMELRLADLGMRFWGPPLRLEVTMTGPDSDRWPIVDDRAQEWNWQSDRPCTEADELAAGGAPDDEVLAALARYTFENLLLNAVHEIGEWLRVDGERPVPAHPPTPRNGGAPVDDEGNGPVRLQLSYGAPGAEDAPEVSPAALASAVAPSLFTYLPGTSIAYEAVGPAVFAFGPPARRSRSTWSVATSTATGSELAAAIGRDVHRAVVLHEADRLSRAFEVDGRRVVTVAGEPELQHVAIALTYTAGPLADGPAQA